MCGGKCCKLSNKLSIYSIWAAYAIRYGYLIYNLTLWIVLLVKVLKRNYSVTSE